MGGALSIGSREKAGKDEFPGGNVARSSVHQKPSSKSMWLFTILPVSGRTGYVLSMNSFMLRRSASGEAMGVCVCRGDIEAIPVLAASETEATKSIPGSMISAKFAKDPRGHPRYLQKSASGELV